VDKGTNGLSKNSCIGRKGTREGEENANAQHPDGTEEGSNFAGVVGLKSKSYVDGRGIIEADITGPRDSRRGERWKGPSCINSNNQGENLKRARPKKKGAPISYDASFGGSKESLKKKKKGEGGKILVPHMKIAQKTRDWQVISGEKGSTMHKDPRKRG